MMGKIMIVFVLGLLSFSSATAVDTGCSHDAENFRCVRYLRNYDGDTVTFNIKGIHPLLGKKIGVRVLGVDAPEMKSKKKCEKKKAILAKIFVAGVLADAKKINLENVKRDKYFRIGADIRFDGISLGEQLLKRGLARPYDGKEKSKKAWCQ